MEKRKREIIALIMLAAFVLAIFCVVRWYLHAGHGWNIAASHLDDSFGDMDGYVVVLYEGRAHVPIADFDDPTEIQKLIDKYKPMTASSVPNNSENDGQSPERTESPVQSEAPEDGRTEAAVRDAEELIDKEIINMDTISTMYREKGAVVFTVRSERLGDYENPFVVIKDGHRYGFMLIGPKKHPMGIQLDMAYLRAQNVDTVIAVDVDPDFDHEHIQGIDAMICMHDCGHNDAGEMINGVFVTDMPDRGKIEATLVSPSYVFTSKIVG